MYDCDNYTMKCLYKEGDSYNVQCTVDCVPESIVTSSSSVRRVRPEKGFKKMVPLLLVGLSGRGMWHVWGRIEIYSEFWWGNLREGAHL